MMRGLLKAWLPAGVLISLLVPLSPQYAVPQTVASEPGAGPSRAELASGWLGDQAEAGAMPGPVGRSDWGLSIDALLAVYASGVGESVAGQIENAIESHAGAYLGPDLYRDADVRLGGSAAALLTAAVVTGSDPTSFGSGRYTRGAYDPRAEVLDLIALPGSPQAGRLRDRGTGNDSTNVFSQSLAVIGLARSGGGEHDALDFLLSQQCRGGYFRMFYNDGKTCNEAGGTPDIDGTAVAVEALSTAQAHGGAGLRAPIARAKRWLIRVQRPDGSFGGVGSSDPPNANTTGLAARALHTLGALPAYRQARGWVTALQITPRNATDAVGSDIGAVAYNPAALARARRTGIDDVARDQWRRATTQAMYAFAPRSLARLGSRAPQGEPRMPAAQPDNGDPDGKPENMPENEEGDSVGDDSPSAGGPGDTSRDRTDERDVEPKAGGDPAAPDPAGDEAATPAGRLAAFLSGRLVDGTHIEVREDGQRYVDYDLTADVALALRILGEEPEAADDATDFLLNKESIAAYAHGKPYEKGDAAYAEPLAKLSLLAQWTSDAARGKASALADQLAGLQNTDGGFDDTGQQADRSMATDRQSLAALALRAAGRDRGADAAVGAIVRVQCEDGSFGANLTERGCATGDLGVTGYATQALAAVRTPDTGAATTGVAVRATDPEPLQRAAEYLSGYGASGSAVPASATSMDVAGMASLAAGKQAVGLDATYLADRIGNALGRDGGVGSTGRTPSQVGPSAQAAPAVAGHSLLSAAGSPLEPVTRVPLARSTPDRSPQPTVAAESSLPLPTWVVYLLAGLLTVVLVLAALLLALRILALRKAS